MSKDINEEATVNADASTTANSGTQPEVIVDKPSQDNAGNDDTQEVIIKSSSKEAPSTENDDTVKPETTQRNLKAEEGKIAKIEKENAEYRKKLQEIEGSTEKVQGYEKLNNFYKDHPAAWEALRQEWLKTNGVDLGDHATAYGTTQNNSSLNRVTVRTQDELIAEAQKAGREAAKAESQAQKLQVEFQGGFKEFTEEFPEMDPTEMTDEQKAETSVTYQKVASRAELYMRDYPDMKIGEALKLAYKALPENMDKFLNTAKQDGERIGKAKVYAKSAGNSEGISGGSATTPSTTTVKMTNAQKVRYDQLLMENPRIAQKYAEQIGSQSK